VSKTEEGLELLLVNTDFWRRQVYNRFWRPEDEPGAWLVMDDCPPEYARHVSSWSCVPRTVRDAQGRIKSESIEWRGPQGADHLLDCEIYLLALADWRFGESLLGLPADEKRVEERVGPRDPFAYVPKAPRSRLRF
jgi:phage terminase large subunit GpA-like protein